VTSTDALLIVTGYDGIILTSPDGINWTPRNSGTTRHLYAAAKSKQFYVVVGDSGTILSSADGLEWTNRTSGTLNDLWTLTRTDSLFVAAGCNGAVLTSPDGVSWTQKITGSNYLRASLWTGQNCLITGDHGITLLSPDGIKWTEMTKVTDHSIYSVAWTGTRYVAVGSCGTILTSDAISTGVARPIISAPVTSTQVPGYLNNHELVVSVPANMRNDRLSYTVYSLSGRCLLKNTVHANEHSININIVSLNPGRYQFVVKGDSKMFQGFFTITR
jgi:photosystem II stability/assembly factor-like uncharacterized protein